MLSHPSHRIQLAKNDHVLQTPRRFARLDAMIQGRRRSRRVRPIVDALEARHLLSGSPALGPAPPIVTWNLQLEPEPSVTLGDVMPLLSAAGATVHSTTVSGLYVIQVPAANQDELSSALSADRAVKYVSPLEMIQDAQVPNDPFYAVGGQWGLNGTWGINAPTAWNTTTGSDRVIVADIDTGINDNHPDLVDNVWLNQAEIPAGVLPNLSNSSGDGVITFSDLNNPANQGPGKIEDTNGDGAITGADVIAPASAGGWADGSTQDGATSYPDDLIGWNFVANTNDPFDDSGHGSHTAGIIGAVGNNGVGVTGVDWNIQIMALKSLNSLGAGTDVAAAEAIDYAVDHGASVINASWGAPLADPTIASAIQYADSKGVIIVASAGNSGTNDDTSWYTPASYSINDPNVITVAAVDSGGNLPSWSNYGPTSVQLAAPGVNILSAFDGSYAFLSGTSMAAPFVTGTVALVESAHPSWSMSQVIDAVLDHTTADPALTGKVRTGGVLNAAAAVANTDGAYITSASPSGSVTSPSSLDTVALTFNAEINPATFTPAQVSVTGPGGVVVGGVTVAAVAGSNDHQFTVSFPNPANGGVFVLKIGPAIQDWYGNNMDQNRDGINGQSADTFSYTINTQSATAKFLTRDAATQGNWFGVYGSQGYLVIGSGTSNPGGATITAPGQAVATWAASTTDPRALQTAALTGRIAACWYSSTSFSASVTFADGQTHDLSLYALDWDGNNTRSEQIQLISAATGAVLDTEKIASFSAGVYLEWAVTGNVVIKVTKLGGANAVLSGLFIDAPAPLGIAASDHLSISGPSTTTIAGTPQNVTVTAVGPAGGTDTHYTGTIQFSSSDALATLPASYTFTAADAGVHTFSIALDTNGLQSITATDLATPTITGSLSVTVGPSVSASAGLIKRDTATQGAWVGTYGAQGYSVIGNATSDPSFATVTTSGQGTATWAASTTDPRALEDATGAGRIAACWYSFTSFTLNVNLTDGQAHDMTMYFLDWDGGNTRSEQIQITSAVTGAVLDTEKVSSFAAGVYLEWAVTGNVVIKITKLGGANAVLSGIFFDASAGSSATAIANSLHDNRQSPPGSIVSNTNPGSIEIGTLSFIDSDSPTARRSIGNG
jgi:serine protease